MKLIQHMNCLYERNSETFSTADYSGPQIEGVRVKLFAYNQMNDLHCELYIEFSEKGEWDSLLVSNDAQSIRGNDKVFDISVNRFDNFRFVVKTPGPTNSDSLDIRIFQIPMSNENDSPWADKKI